MNTSISQLPVVPHLKTELFSLTMPSALVDNESLMSSFESELVSLTQHVNDLTILGKLTDRQKIILESGIELIKHQIRSNQPIGPKFIRSKRQ